jgi:Zn-finger nucleic acid-binding protein
MRSQTHAGIIVERCAACASVWLDAGEFDAVRQALMAQTAPSTRKPVPRTGDWTAFDVIAEATLHLLPALLDG